MEKKTYLTPQILSLRFEQSVMLNISLQITDEDADPSEGMLTKRPSIWDYLEDEE